MTTWGNNPVRSPFTEKARYPPLTYPSPQFPSLDHDSGSTQVSRDPRCLSPLIATPVTGPPVAPLGSGRGLQKSSSRPTHLTAGSPHHRRVACDVAAHAGRLLGSTAVCAAQRSAGWSVSAGEPSGVAKSHPL